MRISIITSGFFSAWARLLAKVLAISSIIDAMPVDDRPKLEIMCFFMLIIKIQKKNQVSLR